MNRKRFFIFSGMIIFCLIIGIVYILYGPKTNDISISNNSANDAKQLRVYLNQGELSSEEDPNVMIDVLENGESVILAELPILGSKESTTRIYGALLPFEGEAFLVYEDISGNKQIITADSGNLKAQSSGNHIRFYIK